MRSLCIVVDIHVAVNNIKPSNVAKETQQLLPFTLLSSYKIFRTASNNETYSRTPLIRTLVIRVGLALRVNLSKLLRN